MAWRAEVAALSSPAARANYLQALAEQASKTERPAIVSAWLDAVYEGVTALLARVREPVVAEAAALELDADFWEEA